MSIGQQGLWFLHRLEAGTLPAYNIRKAVEIEGPLDLPRWQAAFRQVVARHEALRCYVVLDGDHPDLRVAEPSTIAFELVDLTAWTETARQAEIDRRLDLEGRRLFDLARAPLFRASLIRIGAARALFVLNASHLVADAWSAGVFLRELQEAYAGSAPAGGTVTGAGAAFRTSTGLFFRW